MLIGDAETGMRSRCTEKLTIGKAEDGGRAQKAEKSSLYSRSRVFKASEEFSHPNLVLVSLKKDRMAVGPTTAV